MVNEEHYARLKEGVEAWNEWRRNNPNIIPDLSEVDLSRINLSRANFTEAKLSRANLTEADLSEANLGGANLGGANLSGANLSGAIFRIVEYGQADLKSAVIFIGASLRRVNLSGANLSWFDLRNTDFSEANLSKANLIGVDFKNANLTMTNLSEAFLNQDTILSNANLTKAYLYRANLARANLRGLNLTRATLSGADLRGANLSGADLRGADFCEANLSGADLIGADLSELDLSGLGLNKFDLSKVNLSGANLIRTQALGTNFTAAHLTGVCLEDWNINAATKLDNINCRYVYLKSDKQERRPSSGEFAPGEFTKLFQKLLETVDLIFADGIDWKAFLLSFQELQAEYGEENLSVQAIEKKTGGAFVIRLEVPPEANKPDIERQAKELYEIKLNALESIYQAKLQAKDEQIAEYRQTNANLNNIINLLAARPIQNNINVTANAENNSVSETFNNNFNQPNIANFANKNQDDARQQANQHIYQSQQNHNSDGIREEIQQFLNQLARTNPTTDAVTEVVHQKIKTDSNFKARLLAALKAGGLEALKAIFNHPAFSIPAETIKGYLEAE